MTREEFISECNALQAQRIAIERKLSALDNYIYRFGETIVIINLLLAILILTMSLINAYYTFITPHNSRIEQQ